MIYLDMDGVIADYFQHAIKTFARAVNLEAKDFYKEQLQHWPKGEWHIERGLGISSELYSFIMSRAPGFWHDIPIYPDAHRFYCELRNKGDVTILTSPDATDPKCIEGKKAWLARYNFDCPVIFEHHKYKIGTKLDYLIDDKDENIEKWPGIGILVPRIWNKAGVNMRHYSTILELL